MCQFLEGFAEDLHGFEKVFDTALALAERAEGVSEIYEGGAALFLTRYLNYPTSTLNSN